MTTEQAPEKPEHVCTLEDEDGDVWATCSVSGFRGLGMGADGLFGAVLGIMPQERALRTCDRGCPEGRHVVRMDGAKAT